MNQVAEKVAMEELVQRARALIPALRARARSVEETRRVPAETIQMLREAELFRLMQPARYGGFEYGFTELIDIVCEIGRGCGSTAWCYGLGAVHQWLVATFPLQAQEEVWGPDPNTLVCGSYAPAANAVRSGRGFEISGKWSFASNCDNSDWALVGVRFPAGEGEKQPKPGFLLIPRKDYEIEDDWFTVGLAGTGSKSVVVREKLFVPEHRMLTFEQASSNNPPGAAAHANWVYRVPFLAGVPVSIASPALGMVQGAIDEFVEFIGGRTTRGAVAGGGNPMAQFAQVQSRIAEAAAALDAAKLLLKRDTREVESGAAKGQLISVEKRIRNRRDHAYAVRLAVHAVNALFEAVGGGGLGLSSGIQRHWRDVNAVAHHISLNWDVVSTMYGQHYLGLEPKGQY
jgi:alkylation response protein AidB-like acyl-CoA dehydrogenase